MLILRRRNLDHSTILYESKDASPLVRVGWNRVDANFVSCFGLDASVVPIIDVRSPAVPVASLPNHVSVNTVQWAPHSASHIMVGDERGLHLWDLREGALTDPAVERDAIRPRWSSLPPSSSPAHPVVQFAWPTRHPDHVACLTSNAVDIVRI